MREVIKVPRESKITFAKAIWIAKFALSCEARDRSLGSASYEGKIVSDYKTISALHEPHMSRETRTKALSAKDLSREVKNEAPLSANSEAISASLSGRTLCNRAKLAFKAELK